MSGEIETKVCSECGVEKLTTDFTFRKDNQKYRNECKECRCAREHEIFLENPTTAREKRQNRYWNNREIELDRNKKSREKHKEKWNNTRKEKHRANPLKNILLCAKRRARQKKLDFNITENDLFIPNECPVLGIPLFVSEKRPTDNSPTIDRIDNEKGYIKGNVLIVSYKANTIKNSASIDEMEKVYSFYRKIFDEIQR